MVRSKVARIGPDRDANNNIKPNQLRSWEEIAEASIVDSTRRSYETYITQHEACGFLFTPEGLLDHLRWTESGHNRGTAGVLMNAVKFRLRCQDPPVSLTQEQSDQAKMAIKALPRSDEKPRGGISSEMLLKMLQHIDKKLSARKSYKFSVDDKVNMQFNMVVAWMTGLRRIQLGALKRENFMKDDDGKWWILVEKIHDPKANQRTKAQWLTIPITDPGHDDVDWLAALTLRLELLKPEESVLENFNKYSYNEFIRDAAKACGWANDLKFDGLHCLRHGVITQVRQEEGFIAAAIKAGHVVPTVPTTVTDWYSTPNDLRATAQRTFAPEELERTQALLVEQQAVKRLAAKVRKAGKSAKVKAAGKTKTTKTKTASSKKTTLTPSRTTKKLSKSLVAARTGNTRGRPKKNPILTRQTLRSGATRAKRS